MKTVVRRRPPLTSILVVLLLVLIVTISITNADDAPVTEFSSSTSDDEIVDLDAVESSEDGKPKEGTTTTTTTATTTTSDSGSCAVGGNNADSSTTNSTSNANDEDNKAEDAVDDSTTKKEEDAVQVGPFIDLFGTKLLSMNMVDETHAQMEIHNTNEALDGKKVVGIYFSADWCGPCRQFTPELVSFYNKMNTRRGKKDQFEIVWVSSCRDHESFGQYFTHMNWLALPPDEATGPRGKALASKYKVKGIPHLALLDDVGNVITLDGRTKVPSDRAGIGFPWRDPLTTLYVTLVPASLRFLVKGRVDEMRDRFSGVMKPLMRLKKGVAALAGAAAAA